MEGETEEVVDEWDVCPVLVMVRSYVAQLCEEALSAFIPTTTLKKPTSPIEANSKSIICIPRSRFYLLLPLLPVHESSPLYLSLISIPPPPFYQI